jgi:hypothetical protein
MVASVEYKSGLVISETGAARVLEVGRLSRRVVATQMECESVRC